MKRGPMNFGTEIKLENSLLVYRSNCSPEGLTFIGWWEEDSKGEDTGIHGEITITKETINIPYEKLVLDDYKRKIELKG